MVIEIRKYTESDRDLSSSTDLRTMHGFAKITVRRTGINIDKDLSLNIFCLVLHIVFKFYWFLLRKTHTVSKNPPNLSQREVLPNF